jgi:DHA2 family multidrug resistance protein
MMPFIGKSVQSISDPRILIIIGLVSVEFCLFSMTYFSTETSQTQLLNSLYIRGFALAFLFVPINSTILSQFKGFELGQVAGLLNLFRQIGGSIGIALIDTLLTKNMKKNYNELLTHVSSVDQNSSINFNSSMANMSHSMVKDIGLANHHDAALQILYNRVQGQVFMLSFLQLVVVMMAIFAIAFLPIFLIKLKKKVTNISDAH